MSWFNKVVWAEGMLLRPQHFQQQTRYLENYIENRCGPITNHAWGFTKLTIDPQLLSLGKFGISEASGVFPDGTPFNIPHEDEAPEPIEIPENIRETVVYLALPTKRMGTIEVDVSGTQEGLARNLLHEYEVMDSTLPDFSAVSVQVGKLHLRYLYEHDPLGDYACLGIARLIERKTDGSVSLDNAYIPPVLNCQASSVLANFIAELKGLLFHRKEALSGRVTASGHGAAEMADFLLLQVVNRYSPLVSHLATLNGLHPEGLYRHVLEIAGELATFTSESKVALEFPTYQHQDLQATYRPIFDSLRKSLSMVLESTAIALPLKKKRYGIHVAAIADRTLLKSSSFVLAVKADIPSEEIRQNFPAQVKIGAVEQIQELVNALLPGIRMRALPVAPRQIPYHAGYVYFELERGGEYWEKLQVSGGIAVHIGGEFPGILMEFWAIKA